MDIVDRAQSRQEEDVAEAITRVTGRRPRPTEIPEPSTDVPKPMNEKDKGE